MKIAYSLLFAFLFAILIISPSYAQDSPQDFVDAHNRARADVGVGPITWDDTVAAYAQSYANQRIDDCIYEFSGTRKYGENRVSSNVDLSGTDAVQMWVDEKAYFDYNSKTCPNFQQCGHYTQVIWRDSVRLGCAKVRCNNGGTFIGCNYDPPGNVDGQTPY